VPRRYVDHAVLARAHELHVHVLVVHDLAVDGDRFIPIRVVRLAHHKVRAARPNDTGREVILLDGAE
jgi:hypothetical protein